MLRETSIFQAFHLNWMMLTEAIPTSPSSSSVTMTHYHSRWGQGSKRIGVAFLVHKYQCSSRRRGYANEWFDPQGIIFPLWSVQYWWNAIPPKQKGIASTEGHHHKKVGMMLEPLYALHRVRLFFLYCECGQEISFWKRAWYALPLGEDWEGTNVGANEAAGWSCKGPSISSSTVAPGTCNDIITAKLFSIFIFLRLDEGVEVYKMSYRICWLTCC